MPLQDHTNLYRISPPIPKIERSTHLKPSTHQPAVISRPAHNPVSGEKDEGTDDDRTLAELQKRKGTSTSQED
jgi:hypothetical protein